MLSKLDSGVQAIAANPYALLVGLFFTMLPAVVWLCRQAVSIANFFYALIRLGVKEKRRRYKLKLALEARELLDESDFKLWLIYNFIVATFFLVACMVYTVLVTLLIWLFQSAAFLAFIKAEDRGSILVLGILIVVVSLFYQVMKRVVEIGGIVKSRRRLIIARARLKRKV